MSKQTYQTWVEMRRRCRHPDGKKSKGYADRGIFVSPEWDTYEAFLRDMGEKPDGKSIDRKDNNGPYSKENCRWATPKEQANNRRMPVTYGNNKSKISGVFWEVSRGRGRWRAYIDREKSRQNLYSGPDLFEACCQRKAAELNSSAGQSGNP